MWPLVGIAAGWVASRMLGRHGTPEYVIVGVLGSLLGGFLGSALLGIDVVGLRPPGILAAGIGACTLIAVLRAVPTYERGEELPQQRGGSEG